MTTQAVFASFRKNNVWKVPFGSFLDRRTHLHEGSKEVGEQLAHLNAQQGVVVLDAHRSVPDIVATSAILTKLLDLRSLIFPVGAYWTYVPVTGTFFRDLSNLPGFEVFPIFRLEERVDTLENRLKRKFYPQGMTDERKRQMNRDYVQRALESVHQSGHCVVVSPYGGPSFFGEQVRSGVIKLLQSGCLVVCSMSNFSWTRLRYTTQFSELFCVSQDTTEIEIREHLKNVFEKLADQKAASN